MHIVCIKSTTRRNRVSRNNIKFGEKISLVCFVIGYSIIRHTCQSVCLSVCLSAQAPPLSVLIVAYAALTTSTVVDDFFLCTTESQLVLHSWSCIAWSYIAVAYGSSTAWSCVLDPSSLW